MSKPPVANNARLAKLKAELTTKEAELAELRVAKMIAELTRENAELTRENAEMTAELAENKAKQDAENNAKQDAFKAPWIKEYEEILTVLEQLDAEMRELQARIAECKPGNSELAIEQLIKQREILAEKINAGNKKASGLADMLYYKIY